MRTFRTAGVLALALVATYVLVLAVALWISHAHNQAQGGDSFDGQVSFDSAIALLPLLVLAVAAWASRRRPPLQIAATIALVTLPVSTAVVIYGLLANGGF